jgi:type II secretory pathway component GspD/PulD (secretin)
MKFKALTNIGGVHTAFAGQEFEVTNEAQIQDLLHQGNVAHPVDASAEEIAKYMKMDGETLARARAKAIEEQTIYNLANAEATDYVNNKQADTQEQARQEYIQQAREQAAQQVQNDAEFEARIKEADEQAARVRQEVEQQKIIAQANAKAEAAKTMQQAREQAYNQAQQSGQQSQSQQSQGQSQGQAAQAYEQTDAPKTKARAQGKNQ